MSTFLQDIRFGLRMLKKSPGFTLIAVLTLSIGIGANTTIFSSIYAFLLRPLPFDGYERLVDIHSVHPSFGDMSVAFPNFLDWQNRNQCFEDIACFRGDSGNMTGVDKPVQLSIRQVSANLFPFLGVQPFLGRAFQESDDRAESEKTLILNYGFWQKQFAGDSNVIGKQIVIDQESYKIIGVMPQHFTFPPLLFNQCDVWTPIGLLRGNEWFMRRGNHPGISAIAKIKTGVSLTQAQSEMDVLSQQMQKDYPDTYAGCRIKLTNYRESLTGNMKPALMVLMCAVALVLLIVVANISNLLLVRSSLRTPEFAIRIALGAGRFRLICQVVSENLLLVFLGGAGGLLFTLWGLEFIAYVIPVNPSRIDTSQFFQIDQTVLNYSIVVALGAGLLFSLLPAFRASDVNLSESMKDSGRSSTGGKQGTRLREGLVVVEIALALILLVGTSLLMRSFYQYLKVDPGYDPHNVVVMELSLTGNKYSENAQVREFYRNLLPRVQAIPGVRFSGVASNILGEWQSTYYVQNSPIPPTGQEHYAEYNLVSLDYFKAMGIHLNEGRLFTEQDGNDSKPVAIVDEKFAKKWWPDQSAIGKFFIEHDEKPNENKPWREIIGVVSHVKHYGVDQDSRESLFIPMEQYPSNNVSLVVRTETDPLRYVESIRQEVLGLDNELPVASIRTLDDISYERSFMRRFTTSLIGSFAFIALLLALMGIYGVLAYSVSQRLHEFGIRMAMGATMQNILILVFYQGMILTLIGLGIGLLGSLIMGKALSSLLFQVSAFDVWTYLIVSLFLLFVTFWACFLPARRAAKIDPMTALRCE